VWRLPSDRRPHDSWAYVLGLSDGGRRAQVIGDRYFILMEFLVRPGQELRPGKKIYVGKGPRKEVSRFLRYLSMDDLTPVAVSMLEEIVRKIVKENEEFFVGFFNQARPITRRLHQLELLPGVGKKILMRILEEREKKPFESFKDVEERTGLKNPMESLISRILEELGGRENYYVFVATKRLMEEAESRLIGI